MTLNSTSTRALTFADLWQATWDKRAAGLMQKRAQDAYDKDMERNGMLLEYLDGSAEEDLKKYEAIKVYGLGFRV